MTVLGLQCYAGFSLVAASRGYSLVVVHRLLIVVASVVVENRVQQSFPVSVVVVHGPLLLGMWDLSRSGIETVPHMLAGRFFNH